MRGIILFTIIQLINVVLSTIKSIVTVRGSKKVASVTSAISYTFGAIIVKMLATQSFGVAIMVTFITNLVGVYLGKWLIDLRKPVRQWIFNATLKECKDSIEKELQRRNIKYTLVPAENDRWLCVIFSFTKAESALTKEILQLYEIPHSITIGYDTTNCKTV